MESLAKVRAANDYYDDVHYLRQSGATTTLCGLTPSRQSAHGEVTCLRCRQFASGDF